jgi:hypothetical protein
MAIGLETLLWSDEWIGVLAFKDWWRFWSTFLLPDKT